jgi:hypothetical protein
LTITGEVHIIDRHDKRKQTAPMPRSRVLSFINVENYV